MVRAVAMLKRIQPYFSYLWWLVLLWYHRGACLWWASIIWIHGGGWPKNVWGKKK